MNLFTIETFYPFCLFVYSTGLSLQHDISSSLLSYSITDSYTEHKTSEESLSSFPSPELFRGSDYLGEKIISTLSCSTIEIAPLSTNPAMNNVPFEEVYFFSTKTFFCPLSIVFHAQSHRTIDQKPSDQGRMKRLAFICNTYPVSKQFCT